MRFARLCLLLLLALVLPLRGALAQAQPCSAGHAHAQVHAGPGSQTMGAHSLSHATPHLQGQVPASVAMAQDREVAPDTSAATSAQAHGQCSACASCCLGAPLAHAGVAALPVLPAAGAVKFPAGTTPVASVVLDGLERPPRTL